MNSPRIDDTLLHAWLDGELPPEQRAEVEAWLHEHPEDAARVRLWAVDAEALRTRLDPVRHEAVPARLEQLVWTRGPAVLGGGWPRLAAAALVVFALGGVLGGLLGARWPFGATAEVVALAPWVQRAAVAHAVYVPEQRHPVEVSVQAPDAAARREQEAHLARWLTRRLDLPVRLFDLQPQGWALVGGRLLPDAAGPSAQLMYQHAGGARVTVYLRRAETAVPAAFRYERQGELGLFYWVEGATGYALVGALPREALLALAEAIHHQGAETPGRERGATDVPSGPVGRP